MISTSLNSSKTIQRENSFISAQSNNQITSARLPPSKLLTFQEGLAKMPQKPPIQLKKALALAKNEIKPNSEEASLNYFV